MNPEFQFLKSGDVSLRDVLDSDLPIFFENQCDPDAVRMAAVASRSREAFMTHWAKILGEEDSIIKTILCNHQVAGNIASWRKDGKRYVGYWIGKCYWGQGIATQALLAYLQEVKERPLYAHVSVDNVASRRVLEKCGFSVCVDATAANTPEDGIEEVVMIIDVIE